MTAASWREAARCRPAAATHTQPALITSGSWRRSAGRRGCAAGQLARATAVTSSPSRGERRSPRPPAASPTARRRGALPPGAVARGQRQRPDGRLTLERFEGSAAPVGRQQQPEVPDAVLDAEQGADSREPGVPLRRHEDQPLLGHRGAARGEQQQPGRIRPAQASARKASSVRRDAARSYVPRASVRALSSARSGTSRPPSPRPRRYRRYARTAHTTRPDGPYRPVARTAWPRRIRA